MIGIKVHSSLPLRKGTRDCVVSTQSESAEGTSVRVLILKEHFTQHHQLSDAIGPQTGTPVRSTAISLEIRGGKFHDLKFPVKLQ